MAIPDTAAIAEAPERASSLPARDRFLDLLRLDTRNATIAYWAAVSLVALSVFIPKLSPLVDYPQHLALAEIARRLADPAAPEHVTHQLNYFTYNGLFHIIVARLGRLMPIEIAGKLVVSLSLALLGASSLALVRVLKRPPAYAALFVPAIFSFSVGWGFVNYALGTAFAVTACVFVARSLQRPSLGSLLGTAIIGLLCAMTHVLATLILCLFAAALAPELAWRATRNLGRGLVRATVALAPLLVPAAWCIAVYRVQFAWAPNLYKDPTLEGTAPPVWQKIVYFGSWATGTHSDQSDQLLLVLGVAIALVGIGIGLARLKKGEPFEGEASESPPLVVPLIAIFLAYLATPMVMVATHLIFPRLTQMVVLAGVLAIPKISGVFGERVRWTALVIGALAGLNLAVHTVVYAAETDDASRVIDDLPEGRRATAIVWDAETFAYRNGTLVHMAAYYAARKHGDFAFSFARFLSVPVRFRPGGGPPWPQKGWEFGPSEYNPRCKFARRFDLVIIKAPRDVSTHAEAQLRQIVFGRDASAPKLVSHHGSYWAFDTAGLPEDGTF
ncbi:MAG: hypothetical protein ACXVEF_20515 [Polyangiales bacterium]